MAYRPNPNDPFITPPPGDDYPRTTDPLVSPDRFEDTGPVSGTRVALYGVAVLALIGALFYGMSTTSNTGDIASNPAPSTMAQQRPVTPPPPVRDVTPRPNSEPGMTTGSAPSTPAPVPNDSK
jgi:hypothetical protein